MSYLKFDKNLMINLEQSLSKEMLRTNQAGAYHCSSIVGCNTRKQHGLLVIPIPEMDNKSFVMLSSLDETVIQPRSTLVCTAIQAEYTAPTDTSTSANMTVRAYLAPLTALAVSYSQKRWCSSLRKTVS